jgi:hypothetical protein
MSANETIGQLDPKKIHLLDFHIVKGQIDSPLDFDSSGIDGYNSTCDFELGFSMSENLVKADFKASVKTTSGDKNGIEAAGLFHFVYVFRVENLNELVQQGEDKKLTINGGLGNALASITYSTSRGVLMTRFQGTELKDFILPVINPNDLLSK